MVRGDPLIERLKMLEFNSRTEVATRPQAGITTKQPRRLQFALVLLLVALAVVLVKDHEFWFGSDEAIDSDGGSSESVAKTDSPATPVKTSKAPEQAPTPSKHLTAKTSAQPAITAPAQQEAANPTSPVVRSVLPPLDVEVVAGDKHSTIHPGTNIAKVQISANSDRAPAAPKAEASLPTNAAELTRLPSAVVPELRQTIDSNLPVLGQHSRVEGSVVLQAIVGTDGNIENLRVVSGPSILSSAAQQAVREWRFKPYLQNGQPVETKARITVNFSIRVSDNPAKTS
jgi:TonB family protein